MVANPTQRQTKAPRRGAHSTAQRDVARERRMSRLASNRHCKKRTGDRAASACKPAGAKKQAEKEEKKKLRRGGASRSWCLAEGSKHIQACPQHASADLVPCSALIVGRAESDSASRASSHAPRRRRPATRNGPQMRFCSSSATSARKQLKAFSPARCAAISDVKLSTEALTASGSEPCRISHVQIGGHPCRLTATE